MDFIELINKRYSVRAYKPDPVGDQVLLSILEAARLSPSAGNRQPISIIVVHTAGKENELLKIYPRSWFAKAPIVICVCGILPSAWVRKDNKCYIDVDVAIVMDYIILAATAFGLGTCFIAAFDKDNARKVLGLPDDVEPILFTPLGYPDESPKIRERKQLSELVRYEKW